MLCGFIYIKLYKIQTNLYWVKHISVFPNGREVLKGREKEGKMALLGARYVHDFDCSDDLMAMSISEMHQIVHSKFVQPHYISIITHNSY